MHKLPTLTDDFLKEEIYCADICGVNVFFLPKPKFRRRYAELCVNYGSNDNVFVPRGRAEPVEVPAGVAHFLEHKMFEKPWGDAFSAFSSIGASANAYTSNNYTSYHFVTLDNYDKGLALLMEVVFSPYFTEESVEREKRIIAQEIGMYEDQPNWRLLRETLARLYPEHPVGLDISGTYESIQQIHKDTLYLCHENFYSPANCVLFMAGDFDPDQALNLAAEIIEGYVKDPGNSPCRIRPHGTGSVGEGAEIMMSVPTPLLQIGWKDRRLFDGRKIVIRELACAFLLDIMFGKTSEFFEEVYDQGLTDDLIFSYEAWPDYGFTIVSAETEKPEILKEMIFEQVERIRTRGLDEQDFERKKNAALGRFITMFRSFEVISQSQIRLLGLGENIFSYRSILEGLDISDVYASFDSLDPDMSVSVIIANEGVSMDET